MMQIFKMNVKGLVYACLSKTVRKNELIIFYIFTLADIAINIKI